MKERTWPFSVCPPDNAATPGKHNVRKPDGIVVFSLGVDVLTAREACAALNQRWDEAPSDTAARQPSPRETKNQMKTATFRYPALTLRLSQAGSVHHG